MRFSAWTRHAWTVLVAMAFAVAAGLTQPEDATAFLEALQHALPCVMCRHHFVRHLPTLLDAARQPQGTNAEGEAPLVRAVRQLRRRIYTQDARTAGEQRQFHADTAPTASRAMWHFLLACAHQWDSAPPKAVPPAQRRAALSSFLTAATRVWPGATPQRRRVLQDALETTARLQRPQDTMLRLVHRWALRSSTGAREEVPSWDALQALYAQRGGCDKQGNAQGCRENGNQAQPTTRLPHATPSRRRRDTRSVTVIALCITGIVVLSTILVVACVALLRSPRRHQQAAGSSHGGLLRDAP